MRRQIAFVFMAVSICWGTMAGAAGLEEVGAATQEELRESLDELAEVSIAVDQSSRGDETRPLQQPCTLAGKQGQSDWPDQF